MHPRFINGNVITILFWFVVVIIKLQFYKECSAKKHKIKMQAKAVMMAREIRSSMRAKARDGMQQSNNSILKVWGRVMYAMVVACPSLTFAFSRHCSTRGYGSSPL